ncbi:glycoside hydrolase family 2 TIM barrel-domain containing protein [Flammeovirga kamogawensis]|uniref:DUF4982 domain-containing protein n=2 Tax=Flammeovirga kamogawensis TaxID=373891 RepID=A0ABX8H491_9BACT|nr:glycoside hydrolase family 2 TIM barrel-domain containing protein [Flammeovirga kamogawensis]MBB6461696.1 beta-galactosidase [Flammeovirga kamogawensis]QWG10616.1 DUF4982 domain-containing protein [Flammeovirga kamogawensis]
MFNYIKTLLLLLIFSTLNSGLLIAANKDSFNNNWKFIREQAPLSFKIEEVIANNFNDDNWEKVRLPHSAKLEPLPVNNQWQGISWYRKGFEIPASAVDKQLLIEFEAAMNFTQIWINGSLIKEHQGGYLPIVVDITNLVKTKGENTIVVRLDNSDNEVTGPKPLKRLDFNMYGGLYRNAWLISKNKLHITHPILQNKVAGGGIFVTYPLATEEKAIVSVQTHINNLDNTTQLHVVQEILKGKKVIAKVKSEKFTLLKGKGHTLKQDLSIKKPNLWSLDHPNLYALVTKIYKGKEVVDKETTTIGIRRMEFKGTSFYLNGKETFLRGVNRHQEYPFIGYALSDNAQIRDAIKIKQAGFDYVRLSHYPQSPAFMDACDSLGLVVLDAILGWQYYNPSDDFRNQMFNASRDLIRRDRNHACVMAWEVSLNETQMPLEFREKLSAVAHEEYPGDQCFTAGWMAEGWDIYLQARQHRILHKNSGHVEKPYLVSEYGDWEYYSNNAGLNQDKMSKDLRFKTSSRQLREFGEKRLLQQVTNVQEAHNDNLNTSAFADSYWVMYDYTRGYHPDIESSGLMDIFRLPKWGYYFYQSQRSPTKMYLAMVKIGSYWQKDSPLNLRVFSNCDEVKLYLNNTLIGTQKPDENTVSTNLNHPPFTFKIDAFEEGTLKAVGYIKGKEITSDIVRTPKQPKAVKITIDKSSVALASNVNDVVFVYFSIEDENGTLVADYAQKINLELHGDIELMNVGEVKAEAGIGTALIKINSLEKGFSIEANTADNLHGSYEFGAL